MKNKIVGLLLVVASCATIFSNYYDSKKVSLATKDELKLGDVPSACLNSQKNYLSSATVNCTPNPKNVSVSGNGITAAAAKGSCETNARSVCPTGSPSFTCSEATLTSDTCTKCAAGYYLSGGKCYECAGGRISSEGATTCTVCGKGKYEYNNECHVCNGNTYNDKTGQTTCSFCPSGYVTNENKTACTICPANTYQSSTECKPCASGYESAEGSTSCTKKETSTTCTRTTNVSVSGGSQVEVGKTISLSVVKLDGNCSTDRFYYRSSDTSKATVNNGVVTGVSTGEATINVYRSAYDEEDVSIKVGSKKITVIEASQETEGTCTIADATIDVGSLTKAKGTSFTVTGTVSGTCGNSTSDYNITINYSTSLFSRSGNTFTTLNPGKGVISITYTAKSDSTVSKTVSKTITITEGITCPDGYTSDGPAASTADCKILVPKGYMLVSLSNTPKKCPVGTYYASDRYVSYGLAANCTSCGEGHTTAEEGAILSTSCIVDMTQAVSCEKGYYLEKNKHVGDSCTICPVGAWCPGGAYTPSTVSDRGILYCENHYATDTVDGGIRKYVGNGKTGNYTDSSCRIEVKCRRLVMASPPQLLQCTSNPFNNTAYTDELSTTNGKWVNWGSSGQACTGCGVGAACQVTITGTSSAKKGNTVTLTATDSSSNHLSQDKFSWEIVSGPATISGNVVTINSDAKKGEIVTVKVKSIENYGGYQCTDTHKITITEDTPVTPPSPTPPEPEDLGEITSSDLSLCPGDTQNISVTFTKNPANKTLTYSSSDSSVATVDGNGKVTAIKEGSSTITITPSFDVSKKITITVTVGGASTCSENHPVTGIDISPTNMELCPGDKKSIGVTFTPSNATDKRLEYDIQDSQIASVSDSGLVTGLKAGTTVITVRPKANGLIEKDLTVVVSNDYCTGEGDPEPPVPVPPTDKNTNILIYIGCFIFLGLGLIILSYDEKKERE